MEENKIYKLEELSKDRGSYGIAASAVPFSNHKYTYLRITDINDDGTLKKDNLMSVDEKNASDFLLKKNDIVFARTGNSTGRSYFYDGSDGELVFAGFLIKFSIDENKVNPRILKYYTHSTVYYSWIRSFDTGGTRGNINAKTYGEMPIMLPSRKKQDRIVDILKSFDDKIELNNRINANLEEQAQALFRRWFVDFEFPNEQGLPYKSNGGKFVDSELGKIPEGWKIGTLSEIADYLNGLAMQKFRPKDKELGIPVLKIKELGQKSCDSSSDICSESIKPEYIVNDGDVIFSWSGTLKIDIWCGGICGLNQHLFKVTSKIYPKWFYYYWTKQHLNKFIRIAKDKAVTMGHIKREDLDKSQLSIPNNKNFRTMNNIIGPLLEKQITLNIENRFLIQLRDAFLPKLMNNEIKI